VLSQRLPNAGLAEIQAAYTDLPRGAGANSNLPTFNKFSNKGLSATLKRWHPADLTAAINEANAMTHSAFRSAALNYLGSLLSDTGQPITAESLHAFPQEAQAGLLRNAIAEACKQANVPDVINLINLMDNAEDRNKHYASIASFLSENTPSVAKEFIKQMPAEILVSSGVEMVGDIAKYNPQLAMELTESLPTKLQEQGVHDVMAQWAQRDTYAASMALNALPKGACRDCAIAALAQNLEAEPLARMAWIQQIQNPEAKECQLAEYFYSQGYGGIPNRRRAQREFTALDIPLKEKEAIIKRVASYEHTFPIHP
jgi:hypothetical protein